MIWLSVGCGLATKSVETASNLPMPLLLGTAIGHQAVIAVASCAIISAASYLWARKLYSRDATN